MHAVEQKPIGPMDPPLLSPNQHEAGDGKSKENESAIDVKPVFMRPHLIKSEPDFRYATEMKQMPPGLVMSGGDLSSNTFAKLLTCVIDPNHMNIQGMMPPNISFHGGHDTKQLLGMLVFGVSCCLSNITALDLGIYVLITFLKVHVSSFKLKF